MNWRILYVALALLLVSTVVFIHCLPTLQLRCNVEKADPGLQPGWIALSTDGAWKHEPNCIATEIEGEQTEEPLSLTQMHKKRESGGYLFFTPFDLSQTHEELTIDISALDVGVQRFPTHSVEWTWDQCAFLENFTDDAFYFITEVWYAKQVRVIAASKSGDKPAYTFQDMHEIILLDPTLAQVFNHAGDTLTFKDQKPHPIALLAYKVLRRASEKQSFEVTEDNTIIQHTFFEDDPDPMIIKLLDVSQQGFSGPITEILIQVEGEVAHQVEGDPSLERGVRLSPNVPNFFTGKRSNERYKVTFIQDDEDLENKDQVHIEVSKIRLDIES